MATFKSAFTPAEVNIEQGLDDTVSITVRDLRGVGSVVHIDPADAPAIALAVLEAAGVKVMAQGGRIAELPSETQTAARILHVHIVKNAASAKDAARSKRRDELAKEFSELTDNKYEIIGMFGRKAIDRIIDLEEDRK